MNMISTIKIIINNTTTTSKGTSNSSTFKITINQNIITINILQMKQSYIRLIGIHTSYNTSNIASRGIDIVFIKRQIGDKFLCEIRLSAIGRCKSKPRPPSCCRGEQGGDVHHPIYHCSLHTGYIHIHSEPPRAYSIIQHHHSLRLALHRQIHTWIECAQRIHHAVLAGISIAVQSNVIVIEIQRLYIAVKIQFNRKGVGDIVRHAVSFC